MLHIASEPEVGYCECHHAQSAKESACGDKQRESFSNRQWPLDVTRELQFTGADLAKLMESKVPAAMELAGLLRRWQTWRVGRDPVLHDVLPLIALMKPEWCRFENGKVEVELASPLTRGMTKFTPAGRLPDGAQANARVIRAVDKRKLLDLFVSRVTAAPIRE